MGRRESLKEMAKDELVEIVLRLQDQVRELRAAMRYAIEDGVIEGKRRALTKETFEGRLPGGLGP